MSAVSRELGRALFAVVCVTSALGLCAEVVDIGELKPYLSLSYETNIPTWIATVLLFSSAIVAAGIAQKALAFRRHWWGVAAVFAYASLDEAIELHEHLGGNFETGGV